MLKERRINEILELGQNKKRLVAYLPTHFNSKPAVLIASRHEEGVFAYAVYQEKQIVDAACSNFKDYLDEQKINEIWGNNIGLIKTIKITPEDYQFGINKVSVLKANISMQPVCEIAKEENSECDHLFDAIRNINKDIAENILKKTQSKTMQVKAVDKPDEKVNIETSGALQSIEDFRAIAKDLRKNITINMNNEIEKALGIASSNNKIAILLGSTGTGKTRTVSNYSKENGFDLFITTVGQDGNFKKALYGENDVENDENGQMSIVKIPGPMIQALRNIRDNLRTTVLFVDEAFRSDGMGIFTLFSPAELSDGSLYYDIKGIEKQRLCYIENKKSSGWVLLTKDSSWMVSDDMLNLEIQKNIEQDKLNALCIHGKIPRINKKDMESNGFKITTYGEIFQERFQIPSEALQLIIAGNYGTTYDMACKKLDDAVFSRSIVLKIDMLQKTPKELIEIIKNGEPKNLDSFTDISQKEKEIIEHTFVEFLEAIKNGVQNQHVTLPQKAYNLRNIADILSVTQYPSSYANPYQYIQDLIQEYLKYNYIDSVVGRENIQSNQTQEEYLVNILEASFGTLNESPSVERTIEESESAAEDMEESVSPSSKRKM